MRCSRREALTLAGLGLAARAQASLRVPSGGALRLPSLAPRRPLEPSRAVDMADAWPLALLHGCIGSMVEGAVQWSLLTGPPTEDRGNPRLVTAWLRPGMTFADGSPLDADAVARSFTQASSAGPLARCAMAMLERAGVEAAGPRELRLRLAAPGLLDDVLTAWPLALTRGTSGLGPFAPAPGAPERLVPNARCPAGLPWLARVELAPAMPRNDELRAFTTLSLDASWRGRALHGVTRPSERLQGAPSAVVGVLPTPHGVLDQDPAHARALEALLSPLRAGSEPTLAPPGLVPSGAAASEAQAVGALRAALQRRDPQRPLLRLARDPGDALLDAVAERVVALFDAVQVPVELVPSNGDGTLRAIAPLGASPALAVASFLAVAGDEAHASEVCRAPASQRAALAAGHWGRGTAVLLGRTTPCLYLRAGVQGARFDECGRLLLGDAWLERPRPRP